MKNKQKFIVYITSEIHKLPDIRALTDEEPVPFAAKRSVDIYLNHSNKVKELKNLNYRKSRQTYFCRECETAAVINDKQILSLKKQSDSIKESVSFDIEGEKILLQIS